MSEHSALLSKCQSIPSIIAPELQARPLYVLDSAELEGVAPRGTCLGWALSSNVDYNVKDRLAGRWQGAGPVISLDMEKIAAEANPGKLESCVFSVVAHEIAHILPAREPAAFCREPSAASKQLQWKIAQRELTAPAPALAADVMHGPEFIRRLVHCVARAMAAGFQPCIDGILSWPCQLEHYVVILAGEILKMRDATFAQIEAQPAPALLYEQWQADLEFDRISLLRRGTK